MLTDEEKRRIEAEEQYRASVRANLATQAVAVQSEPQISDSVPIYKNNDVMITKTLVKIGNQSYPTNSIGSVSVRNSNVGAVLVLLIFSVIACISAKSSLPVLLVILFGIIFIRQFLRAELIVTSNSRDYVALKGSKKSMMVVKQAIEEAVARRG
ncbi:DUF6232 family protein [Rhizobium calliandrae]|uniref:DUF6232 family protein n=1 Tax=Rhizobium calliandrae TaxID=1312182 RepID=A0ABT7KPT1_9HYPH|nr:DUF6232 family protein [Rhizobium calliandrae]MDL2409953.1 DUF6232 family protein [Rhizobium calliandrae]